MFKLLKLKGRTLKQGVEEQLSEKELKAVLMVNGTWVLFTVLSLLSLCGAFVSLVGLAVWQAPFWLFAFIVTGVATFVFMRMLKRVDLQMSNLSEKLEFKYRDQ